MNRTNQCLGDKSRISDSCLSHLKTLHLKHSQELGLEIPMRKKEIIPSSNDISLSLLWCIHGVHDPRSPPGWPIFWRKNKTRNVKFAELVYKFKCIHHAAVALISVCDKLTVDCWGYLRCGLSHLCGTSEKIIHDHIWYYRHIQTHSNISCHIN